MPIEKMPKSEDVAPGTFAERGSFFMRMNSSRNEVMKMVNEGELRVEEENKNGDIISIKIYDRAGKMVYFEDIDGLRKLAEKNQRGH